MLSRIHVQNFKSIANLTLEPGAVNVLIGENGCGKSNFLEALAFASAASANKLDNEFLASRGIRVTEPEFMRSAFKDRPDEDISLDITTDEKLRTHFEVSVEKKSHYPYWAARKTYYLGDKKVGPLVKDEFSRVLDAISQWIDKTQKSPEPFEDGELFAQAMSKLRGAADTQARFIIYSPENSALRTFAQEGQVLPLGIKGEGLFKLLSLLSTDTGRWEELKSNLKMIDWFRDLKVAPEQAPFEQTIQIKDRFLAKDLAYFDQRSANEGFLFLLFYLGLMISPDTPTIFAIDNIDVSLNPKTATAVTSRLAKLAKQYKKQIFLTTHSPAVLDGLDLTDPEQRLFVFQRNRKGETRCRRATAPQPVAGEPPIKLSEAFLRGLIGGLPQNF